MTRGIELDLSSLICLGVLGFHQLQAIEKDVLLYAPGMTACSGLLSRNSEKQGDINLVRAWYYKKL